MPITTGTQCTQENRSRCSTSESSLSSNDLLLVFQFANFSPDKWIFMKLSGKEWTNTIHYFLRFSSVWLPFQHNVICFAELFGNGWKPRGSAVPDYQHSFLWDASFGRCYWQMEKMANWDSKTLVRKRNTLSIQIHCKCLQSLANHLNHLLLKFPLLKAPHDCID